MIDLRALDRLRQTLGDNPDDLLEKIVSVLEEAPLLLRQMERAVAEGDSAMLRRSAQSLRADAMDFGALDLAELCRGLEDELRSGQNIGAGAARVAQIRQAWALAEPDLKRLSEGGAHDPGRRFPPSAG